MRAAVEDRVHVCVVVNDGEAFAEQAAAFLAGGNARGEKTVAFGPQGGALLARLAPLAAIATDPYADFLGRRGLEPDTLFAMFREQAALAASEGYARLRVAADMDWLVPAEPTAAQIVGFEALLDRVVRELGANVLCAYRRASFEERIITGALCVHPVRSGHDEEPPFLFVACDGDCWRLSGAVDFGGADDLARALAAVATAPCEVDASGLEFIDVAGMRAIAQTARRAGVTVRVRNAPPAFERYWRLAGFDALAPTVAVQEARATPSESAPRNFGEPSS
jgi:anti-anti-sigma regulatory factor